LDKPKIKISIFVGGTEERLLKFLKENKLNTIDPEQLADYVRKAIINFEKKDIEASNRLINEIWDIVGVKDPDIATEVARQFGKLCDTYRTIFQSLTGEENLSEDLERDV